MKRVLFITVLIFCSVSLMLGQSKFSLGEAAMKKGNYDQAITYFTEAKKAATDVGTVSLCNQKIAECNRLKKDKAEQARREQEQRQQARREQEAIEAEQARREQEAIEAKQRRVVNEQGILYVYFPNGKSDLWADQKRDIKSYVETIGALHKDVLLEITTIENSAMGKAGGRLAQQRTDAVLDVIKSCGNYRIIERNLGGTEENDEKDIVTIIASWPTSGYENGHEWVDLGLSVKWATVNLGADSPSDYGNYYAWGETSTKAMCGWSAYKWCNGSYNSLTKYNTKSDCGSVDNRTRLSLSDDAARANWGGHWRMSTKEEFDELKSKCTWKWTTEWGVNGYKVTGKNGNSIFLPAAGFHNGTYLLSVGSVGHYWSSSLDADIPSYAWLLFFFDSSDIETNSGYRNFGLSVRPVTE